MGKPAYAFEDANPFAVPEVIALCIRSYLANRFFPDEYFAQASTVIPSFSFEQSQESRFVVKRKGGWWDRKIASVQGFSPATQFPTLIQVYDEERVPRDALEMILKEAHDVGNTMMVQRIALHRPRYAPA